MAGERIRDSGSQGETRRDRGTGKCAHRRCAWDGCRWRSLSFAAVDRCCLWPRNSSAKERQVKCYRGVHVHPGKRICLYRQEVPPLDQEGLRRGESESAECPVGKRPYPGCRLSCQQFIRSGEYLRPSWRCRCAPAPSGRQPADFFGDGKCLPVFLQKKHSAARHLGRERETGFTVCARIRSEDRQSADRRKGAESPERRRCRGDTPFSSAKIQLVCKHQHGKKNGDRHT